MYCKTLYQYLKWTPMNDWHIGIFISCYWDETMYKLFISEIYWVRNPCKLTGLQDVWNPCKLTGLQDVLNPCKLTGLQDVLNPCKLTGLQDVWNPCKLTGLQDVWNPCKLTGLQDVWIYKVDISFLKSWLSWYFI